MKILIIKIGAIGDVIMTLPVIAEIKKVHPESHITWICGNVVKNLLSEIPAVDSIISIDERKLFADKKLIALKEVMVFQANIAFKRFDMVLNFHPDKRYKILSMLVRATKKIQVNRVKDRPDLIPDRVRAFEHVRLFLQNDDNYTGTLQFPTDTIGENKFAAKRHLYDYSDKPFVIISPGGAKNTLSEQMLRRWPIENYVVVAKYLVESGIDVVITGIESDKWVLPYFDGVRIIDLVGQLSLIELIALMKKSKLVLTHDSGPFHLAAFAQSCYLIGLFGPTNPNELSYGSSFGDRVKILWDGKRLLCSPCYFGKYFSTQCRDNVCMKMISPQRVIDLATSLIFETTIETAE